MRRRLLFALPLAVLAAVVVAEGLLWVTGGGRPWGLYAIPAPAVPSAGAVLAGVGVAQAALALALVTGTPVRRAGVLAAVPGILAYPYGTILAGVAVLALMQPEARAAFSRATRAV